MFVISISVLNNNKNPRSLKSKKKKLLCFSLEISYLLKIRTLILLKSCQKRSPTTNACICIIHFSPLPRDLKPESWFAVSWWTCLNRQWCDGSSDRSSMVDPLSYFSFQQCAPRLVYQRPWYVLSCLWDGPYKITLAVNRKE